MATFHLDREALQWHQWYSKTHPTPSWDEFIQQLLIHFGPSDYEDFTGALTKLHQTTIFKEYQNQFEKLANHIEGLDDTFFKSCFINGLKEEHKLEVKMFNPKTMMDAIALAKLAEDKASAHR